MKEEYELSERNDENCFYSIYLKSIDYIMNNMKYNEYDYIMLIRMIKMISNIDVLIMII